MSQQPAIQITNLCKTFRGKRGRKVQALDNVDFAVNDGEVFGFLGPNGAGKSTTIKTIMGLIRPTSGEVLLCNRPVKDVKARQNVGYLPENPAFYDFLSGRNYLRFVARSFQMPVKEADGVIEQTLGRLDLLDAADRLLRSYSKGMVQRLGLAQTLIHDPQIFILDEPMSGLDPQGRALVKDIIRELGQRGKTVFFSTHITSDVEKICDRLAIICKGRLQVVTSVDEILMQGVEGYRLIARNIKPDGLDLSVQRNHPGESSEFHIKPGELLPVLEKINSGGGTIELLEPLRRDLETYFLDVVNKSS